MTMKKSLIPGIEYFQEFDISDQIGPNWHTVERCTLPLKTGAELTAVVSGDDIDLIIWTLTRTFEGQTLVIGGSTTRETSLESAREAAWNAMTTWRDTVEYRAINQGLDLSQTFAAP